MDFCRLFSLVDEKTFKKSENYSSDIESIAVVEIWDWLLVHLTIFKKMFRSSNLEVKWYKYYDKSGESCNLRCKNGSSQIFNKLHHELNSWSNTIIFGCMEMKFI